MASHKGLKLSRLTMTHSRKGGKSNKSDNQQQLSLSDSMTE